ncbi:probable 28S ribosomal protein S23, mitochondrial [Anopheles arabiensis]|uniref:Small ribosomal subunit protein mS23 n=4 Tax=gambiae species complex TaxID=44542 RepID=Q7QD03_ANOGA|nr:probable 28S ribosomal protein S23, mitochondrial [Anopheles arabiensis]XP_040226113.1 probable 28S ribosomal protein S23, mitochondrial [Anopheles coluzzii]XP_312017.5 small ribosomal subunit protein mS23 [Anopheles gambiae]EAA08013.5 AGAP002893-PA [Anopheles gambiae str. PEST]
MANSRLEKIGTIITRTQGLLKSGAMKFDERPLWYDVVTAFPPHEEPRYDRPAPRVPVRQIFYQEDTVRAKFHKSGKATFAVNLLDHNNRTPTQQFIELYQSLSTQGALDEEQVFATAIDLHEDKMRQQRLDRRPADGAPQEQTKQTPVPEESGKTVKLQDIFKD